jgi:hypothetical protein
MESPPSDLLEIPTEEAVSLEKERQLGGTLQQKEAVQHDDKGSSKKRKTDSSNGSPTRKIRCARPFAQMRGHSAFLTFATAGNTLRPDPNASLT